MLKKVSNLANSSSLIYHGLREVTGKPINWVGFYLRDKANFDSIKIRNGNDNSDNKDIAESLILGPFQGRVSVFFFFFFF
jgi:L-methionine (R)-S-oxide reductase